MHPDEQLEPFSHSQEKLKQQMLGPEKTIRDQLKDSGLNDIQIEVFVNDCLRVFSIHMQETAFRLRELMRQSTRKLCQDITKDKVQHEEEKHLDFSNWKLLEEHPKYTGFYLTRNKKAGADVKVSDYSSVTELWDDLDPDATHWTDMPK